MARNSPHFLIWIKQGYYTLASPPASALGTLELKGKDFSDSLLEEGTFTLLTTHSLLITASYLWTTNGKSN